MENLENEIEWKDIVVQLDESKTSVLKTQYATVKVYEEYKDILSKEDISVLTGYKLSGDDVLNDILKLAKEIPKENKIVTGDDTIKFLDFTKDVVDINHRVIELANNYISVVLPIIKTVEDKKDGHV